MPSSNFNGNNRVLVMLGDNVCRVHGVWGWYPDEDDNPHPEYGHDDKGFRNRYWRYDAETNTLYTKIANSLEITSRDMSILRMTFL